MSVVPYLTIPDGRAAEAADFYKALFGAKETVRMPADDGKRLMHVALDFHGGTLFLSDDFTGHARYPSMCSIFVRLEKPGDVDALVAKAKGAGATVSHGPEDMFWGDRFATFSDPFGHSWQIGAAKG
ncbi:MAG: VOC family protein [Rhizomicrobium sp.]